jgi:hypothetical protein
MRRRHGIALRDTSALRTSPVLVYHATAHNHESDVARKALSEKEFRIALGKETYTIPAIRMKMPGTQEAL